LITAILASNPIAVRTKSAAGRACSATSGGSLTVRSELSGTAGLLGGAGDFFKRESGGGGDRGCDRTLDQGSVDDADAAVRVSLEHMSDCEEGASEVSEHHHPLALLGGLDRAADQIFAGSEAAIVGAPRPLDPHVRAGPFHGKLDQPTCDLWTVRYDYDPDHFIPSSY
jgi:hypothetical protein